MHVLQIHALIRSSLIVNRSLPLSLIITGDVHLTELLFGLIWFFIVLKERFTPRNVFLACSATYPSRLFGCEWLNFGDTGLWGLLSLDNDNNVTTWRSACGAQSAKKYIKYSTAAAPFRNHDQVTQDDLQSLLRACSKYFLSTKLCHIITQMEACIHS